MPIRSLFAFAALSVAIAAPVVSAQDAERHTLSGERVAIWNLAGRAVLEPTSGREVVVEVVRGGDDGGRLTVEARGDRLVVRYPERDIVYRDGRSWNSQTRLRVEDDGTFGNDGDDWGGRTVSVRTSGSGLEAHADLRIQVPDGQRLTLHVGIGEIEVRNVNGLLDVRTRASQISGRDLKGELIARTGSGRIDIARADLARLQASTGSGGMELVGVSARELRASTGSGTIEGSDVTAERLHASTGSGGVRLASVTTSDLRASSGSGGVRLELMTTPRDATISSGSGRVSLTLPTSTNAELDLRTGSGGISTEFAVSMESMRRNQLRGRIGSGADGRIRVTTGSGGVQLYRR